MRRPSLRENRFDLTLRCTIYVVFSFTVIAGAKQGSWPPCTATQTPPAASSVLQQQQEPARLDVLARPTGCALAFTTHPGRPTSEHGAAPTALVVSGVHNSSIARSPVVTLSVAAAPGIPADDTAANAAQAALVLPAGGTLLLQDLLLANITLANPKQTPSQALLPAALQPVEGLRLQLVNVMMLISTEQLQQYIAFLAQFPELVLWTDNSSFLHIRSYGSAAMGGLPAAVEGSTVTLIAPAGATIGNASLPVLQSVPLSAGGSLAAALPGGVDPAAVAAAQGDPAGIVTSTDSYVLGAVNSTLVQNMRQLAGQRESKQPLLVVIASNVTLSPASGDPDWPVGGIAIKRPVVWVGSSTKNTSVDFHMEVGQFMLEGQWANVTLVNLVLENLAYGDALSARDSEGKSLSRSHLLWAFRYRRSVPRLVLWDCVMVFPEQIQVDNAAYWSDAFNSDLPFWKDQTAFMRSPLGITVQKYKHGNHPGEYIMTIVKKDQQMTNVTYTAHPYIAPLLKLVIDPTLHSDIVTYRADPAVGPVYTREDVAVTLYNMQRSGCQRSYILLPIPPADGVVDWGAGPLNFSGPASTPAPATAGVFGSGSQPEPVQPLRASQLLTPNGTAASAGASAPAAAAQNGLPAVWPAPGGELVRCPVQFSGVSSSDQPSTVIDVGFVQGLFRLADSGASGPSGPGQPGTANSQAAAPAPPQTAGTAGRAPALQFGGLRFRCLPQGPGYDGVVANGSAAAPPPPPAAGGAPAVAAGGAAVSTIPAEAYTHLLWFISRSLAGQSRIAVTNVTLQLPTAEAAQLEAAANAAIAAAGGSGDAAVLSLVYPTSAGPLPVVYRRLWFADAPAGASTAGYASLFIGRHRRMMLTAGSMPAAAPVATGTAPAAATTARWKARQLRQTASSAGTAAAAGVASEGAPASGRMLCVGSIEGLGLSGSNVCMIAQDANAPLPPGYLWPLDSSVRRSSSRDIIVAVAVSVVTVVCLAAAAVALGIRHKWWKRRQQAAAGKQSASVARHSSDYDLDACKDPAAATRHVEEQFKAPALPRPWSAADKLQQLSGGGAETTDSASSADAAADATCGGAFRITKQNGRLATPEQHSDRRKRADSQGTVCLELSGHAASSMECHASGPGAAVMAEQMGTAAAAGAAGAAVVVGLGEELSRLAAIHKTLLVSAGGDEDGEQQETLASAALPVREFIHQPGPDMQGQRDQPGRDGDGDRGRNESGRDQPTASGSVQQPSTAQRLSHAISAVSAELHMRRGLSGTHSCGSAASASITGPSVSSSAGDAARAAAADKQAAHDHQQHHQQQLLVLAEHGQGLVSSRPQQQQQQQAQQQQQLQLHEVIGNGSFGVVYRGSWRGITAAVKVVHLPAAACGSGYGPAAGLGACQSRREQMAVMETALGSSLSHPNIVQLYTYHLRPLGQRTWLNAAQPPGAADGSNHGSDASVAAADEAAAANLLRSNAGRAAAAGGAPSVTGYELQLVMEFCPLGSLRAAIDGGLFEDRLTGRPQYLTVLNLALGVARAMHHLHSEGVLHGDLKAGNVLLTRQLVSSSTAVGGGCSIGVNQARDLLVAKVADFGLACRIPDQDTHISGVHRGTLSHMSPELLAHGHASRASDAYAMGILLFEMATGLKAFAGVAKAMLGAAVVRDKARPEWPTSSSYTKHHGLYPLDPPGGKDDFLQPPQAYRQLAEQCWAHEPHDRPSFAEVSAVLEDLLQHEQQRQNVAVPKHLSHHQQQQWAAAAGLQTAAASAAPVAAQPREPDAGIVSALNKLLGPGPAASRASRPAQAAPAAVPAQHAATKAPRRQYSVTLAEPAGSDAPQPAAAAEFLLAPPLVATSTAAATAQGANSQQKEAGGNRARLSSIDGNDAAIRPRTGSSAGSAAARLNPRRRATIAAIAAVLDVKRPPAPGSSSSSSSGASLLQDAQQPRRAATRLDSVKEEVAE